MDRVHWFAMRTRHELETILRRIDGRGYKAYKDLRDQYDFSRYRLSVDHVQGDPFAAPSRVSAVVAASDSGFPSQLASTRPRRIAAADFLTRVFGCTAATVSRGNRGTGGSGRIEIDCGGQAVLERNSCQVSSQQIEIRFTMGLPAAGRRVLGRQAAAMFFEELPRILEQVLFFENLPQAELRQQVETCEDQEALRRQMAEQDLVAFVADGAILPRRSGVDDRPLGGSQAIPFESPEALRCRLSRPNHGPIEGMGLPPGVHLIVGGGFHGKSTLLRALERGVYDHLPGDGREWVLADASACKIRAEDGRSIRAVDISPFISNLPLQRDTRRFSTDNASGSTSQAANIVEALEMGSRLLLIDEDTSATNFMLRDGRMQRLIAKSKEPITPLIDRVRELFESHGVSTVLVSGGSGDYFDVADRVIQMDAYHPREVTTEVRRLVAQHPSDRQSEAPAAFQPVAPREPLPAGFDARRGKRAVKIEARGRDTILFGREFIDLAQVEQLVDTSQTRAIGLALHLLAREFLGSGHSLSQGLDWLEQRLDQEGLDALSPFKTGNLARPRRFETGAAINRMRSLKAKIPQ